jgi:phosphatidylinositol alpha-mannosyltransferase
VKLAMWHSTLPALGRKLGGVEVHVHRLSNRLVERGHDVTVFSLTTAPDDALYRHTRVTSRDIHQSKLKRLTFGSLLLNRVEFRGDVVHLHGDDWFYLNRRLPTVRTFYGSSWREAQSASAVRRRVIQTLIFPAELLAARLATKTYVISPDLAKLYGADGLIPCAVDVPTRFEVRRDGAPTILFVGTWEGRKRGAALHSAFQQYVLPRIPDARLLMVCDREVYGPGVEWIEFPSDDELRKLYGRAHVFCLPSSYEGFGIPYAEAMSQATPVVSTPNPGAEYVLDGGRAGVLTSLESLGESLVRLLEDETERARVAVAGRERAADFGWPSILDAHERAYEAALAETRR